MGPEVQLIRTRFNRTAVIFQGYYFFRNRCYKDVEYWSCAHGHCPVRLIRRGPKDFRVRNQGLYHDHPPNAPNLVEKRFRQSLLRRVEADPTASVRDIYDDTRLLFINEGKLYIIWLFRLIRLFFVTLGISEDRIPNFTSVRSSMYWKRKKIIDAGNQPEPVEPPSPISTETAPSGESSDHSGPSTEGLSQSPPSPQIVEEISAPPPQVQPLDLSTKVRNETPVPAAPVACQPEFHPTPLWPFPPVSASSSSYFQLPLWIPPNVPIPSASTAFAYRIVD